MAPQPEGGRGEAPGFGREVAGRLRHPVGSGAFARSACTLPTVPALSGSNGVQVGTFRTANARDDRWPAVPGRRGQSSPVAADPLSRSLRRDATSRVRAAVSARRRPTSRSPGICSRPGPPARHGRASPERSFPAPMAVSPSISSRASCSPARPPTKMSPFQPGKGVSPVHHETRGGDRGHPEVVRLLHSVALLCAVDRGTGAVVHPVPDDGPSVVAAPEHEVHLVAPLGPVLSLPDRAGFRIDRQPLGASVPVAPDFRKSPWVACEGVVGWYAAVVMQPDEPCPGGRPGPGRDGLPGRRSTAPACPRP